ncbi:MAG: hypothetical protein DMF71_12390 [Acidobacteria bacterium]|nr:MAG: hypothetical protein DMF71_12390 [Acidobacteriota bacterium]
MLHRSGACSGLRKCDHHVVARQRSDRRFAFAGAQFIEACREPAAIRQLVLDSVRKESADGFDELIGQVRARITRWPFYVLIRGLSFDEGNKVFVAINRAFGELVARPYEKPRAQLVHYVEPSTDLPSVRGGHESERLHTDTADWETPVELISMVCVRADPRGGGRSRALDIDSIRDEVNACLGTDFLSLLETEAVPWQLAPYFGGGVKWRPVLNDSTVCWRRYTIDLEMLNALAAFEDVIGRTDRTSDFLMREGELLFSDNHRTIHARTPISDLENSSRLMIRSWIRTS